MNPCKYLQEFVDRNLENLLTAHIIVSSVGGKASTRIQPTDPTDIAEKWGIGLESACRTLECTTLRGLRKVLHPSLSRCFQTNERQLRYRRLRHDVFSETLLAGTNSKRGKIMPRYLSQSLYGPVRFSWIRRGVHMRLFPCCFNGM